MNNLLKKVLSCFLILTFVFTSVPFAAFADETTSKSASLTKSVTESDDGQILHCQYINPGYENLASYYVSESKSFDSAINSVNSSNTFNDINSAAKYLKKRIINKDPYITVCINTSTDWYDLVYEVIEKAFEHTGVPTEGDYLKWNNVGWSAEGLIEGSYKTVVYEPYYTTTLQQEKELTTWINQLVKEFSKEANNYKKVLAIYDWLTDNITYAHTNMDVPYYHSSHSGIATGTTVCQGYSTLFYRLALELDIDCRFIGSIAAENHCWNIVQLGNRYYNLDATWGAQYQNEFGLSPYSWFLLGNNTFKYKDGSSHTRDAEYNTATFNKKYPTATTDFNVNNYTPSPKLTVTTSKGNPKLSWTTLKNVSKYQIYRSKTGKAGSYSLVKTVTDGTTWTNTSVTKGQKYYYKVRAIYTNGLNSEYSAVKTITAKLAAPTNLKATNVASSGKIKLTWSKVTDATKYEIWRSKTGKDGSFSKIYTTSNTSYTNTSASAGTLYYYKVKAINSNSAATSSFSTVKSLRCDLPQVKNVTVKNVASSGKPKITWDAVDGAVKYEVWRSKTGKEDSFDKIYTTSKTYYTNTGAKAGTKYYYKVKAVHSNTYANGALSEATNSIVCDLANPKVKISLNSKGKPMLKWDAMDDVKNYEIWRSTTGKSGSFEKIYTVSGTAKSYTNSNAKKGVTYYYKVKAVHSNAYATSAFSTAVTIKSK